MIGVTVLCSHKVSVPMFHNNNIILSTSSYNIIVFKLEITMQLNIPSLLHTRCLVCINYMCVNWNTGIIMYMCVQHIINTII